MNDNDQTVTNATESVDTEQSAQTTQEIDLDGVSSFKFQGQTYTPDQFTEIYQGYQKYGETSKYVEQDQTYWANVEHDIEKVLKNPARIEEFKQVYPERFHRLLENRLNTSRSGESVQSSNGQVPKELLEKFQTVDQLKQQMKQIEERAFQADVASASAKIDAILPNLLKKYELADQESVLVAAEKALSRGQKLTDAAWERLVREDHEKTQKRSDKFYEAKLKSQLKQGQKGADVGPGGATPGQAPVKPKNFAEAQEAMIASLRARHG